MQNEKAVNPAKTVEVYKVAVVKKFYVPEIVALNLSKLYFLKNSKKTCKPNDRDLNRDWKNKKKMLKVTITSN